MTDLHEGCMITPQQTVIEIDLGSFCQKLVGSITSRFQKAVWNSQYALSFLLFTSGGIHASALDACFYDKHGITPRSKNTVSSYEAKG